AALAGAPELVKPIGQFNVYMEQANADRAKEIYARTPIGTARTRDMTQEELARYDGALRTRPADGLFFSGTGQISDPQGARDALLVKFAALGGEIATESVVRVVASGRAELASGKSRDADAVLVACGAWSSPLMKRLGLNAPLIGERGYSMQSTEH